MTPLTLEEGVPREEEGEAWEQRKTARWSDTVEEGEEAAAAAEEQEEEVQHRNHWALKAEAEIWSVTPSEGEALLKTGKWLFWCCHCDSLLPGMGGGGGGGGGGAGIPGAVLIPGPTL